MEHDIRKIARNTLIVLIMTGLIAYAVYHCLLYFRDPVQTTVAVRQTETMTQTFTAYLFRDEEVLTASHGGTLQSLAEDGAHVAVGTEVARMYTDERGDELYEELEQLNAEIAFCESCLAAAGMPYSELPNLSAEISQTYGEVMDALAAGDGTRADALSEELLLLLNQKQILTGEMTDVPARLAELQAQKQTLEVVYAGTYQSITTARSGYYFRKTDGYETAFSNSALNTISLTDFYTLIEQPPQSTVGDAGKLIGDYIWYAALPATLKDCEEFEEGYTHTVIFDDGTSIDMTLDRILTAADDDRAVLIFKTGTMPQDFAYTRVQTVTVEVGQTQGLRIPQTALVVGKDGEMGVYILDIAYVRYRKIEIIWRGDGYVLARETDRTAEGHENDLGYQELLITRSDQTLYDGQLLN